MSILQCSRRGCENTLCRRLSINHGYLCEECFDELVLLGPSTDITRFMKTVPPGVSSYEYFANLFSCSKEEYDNDNL